MKRAILLLLLVTPLLSGCSFLYTERREVEQLRLAETMGLDAAPGGVLLSLASFSGAEEENASCSSAVGASVSDAMERLQQRSLEGPLFCGHLQHILVGEGLAREGLLDLLSYVCHSSDLRLDMPVFLLLDASAKEAMTAVEDGKGIADVLSALEQAEGEAARLSSAGTILRNLDGQGAALVRTLCLAPSAEEGEKSGSTVEPDGYGVLVDGKLRALIHGEDALGVALLTDTLRPSPLVLEDASGRRATVELQESSCRLQPLWGEDGALNGLEIRVRVQGAALEIDDFSAVTDPHYADALTARLESSLSRRIGNVLELSQSLGVDFLGLGRRLEQASPIRGRGLSRDLGVLLPSLRMSVSVQGELRHAGDMN